MFALIWEAMCHILVVPEIMVGSKTFRTPLYITFNEVPLVDVHVSVQSLLTLKPLFEFRASFTCTFIWFRVCVCGLMSRQLRFISEFLFACLALPFFLSSSWKKMWFWNPDKLLNSFIQPSYLQVYLSCPPCLQTWWALNSIQFVNPHGGSQILHMGIHFLPIRSSLYSLSSNTLTEKLIQFLAFTTTVI